MTTRRWLVSLCVLSTVVPSLLALQRFRGRMADWEDPPPGANEETEFYFTRLAYQSGGGRGRRGRGGAWMTDTPAAERHFLQGVRRLTNIHARSMENYMPTLDDRIFDYPWIYAVEVGQWYLNEEEAAHLREYLLRGGFLVCDDFHGMYEWMAFQDSMNRVFPDRPIVEIGLDDPVMHVLYDVDNKVQIPGIHYPWSGRTYEREDGFPPHWRGIYDDNNRLMVVINFNMDLGDAWEHADEPAYPENFTALAYKFGINYIIYSMTH
jgi:hypothetical protein